MRNRLTSLILSIVVLLTTAVPAMAADGDKYCYENKPHEWEDWTVEVAATCSDYGLKSRFCMLCGAVESVNIPPTGKHIWSAWKTTKAATISKTGIKSHTCEYCREIRTAKIKKLKPFVKFVKKTYTLKKGKTTVLKPKFAKGDKVKSWKSSNKKIATINKKGKITAKKAGTATITVTMKSGRKATCKIKVTKPKAKKSSNASIVHWTPSGSVYHFSNSCSTLKRSKTIYSGSISESGKPRACKVCGK